MGELRKYDFRNLHYVGESGVLIPALQRQEQTLIGRLPLDRSVDVRCFLERNRRKRTDEAWVPHPEDLFVVAGCQAANLVSACWSSARTRLTSRRNCLR